MRINKITIKNFRSYKEATTFDFTFEDNKNIILIGGENGSGKSSIFEAMKICLYGPLTYKYSGMVTNYIARIKSMINEDVYLNENIKSFIELDIDMTNKGISENYKVRRQWSFNGPKLIEDFIVKSNDRILDETESNNFYEYFKSIIPISIFDISFFDGEKLIEFFEDKISGKKLKDTMLTLNNFDVFNILSRELELNTRRKNREKKNLKNEIQELELTEEIFLKKKKELNKIYGKKRMLKEEINKLYIEIGNKNNEFINAGGLNQEERENLVESISKCESKRDSINLNIKSFANNILPFLMTKNQLNEIEKQVLKEEEFIAYQTIKDRVDIQLIKEKLKSENLISGNIDYVIEEIINYLIPDEFDEKFKPIHYLSKEQTNKIVSKTNEVNNLDYSEMNYFQQIGDLTEKIAMYRQKLRNSMDMNEERKYIETIESMNKKLNARQIELENVNIRKIDLEKKIELEQNKLVRLNEKVTLIKKADNIKDISDDIVNMTDELLREITISKRKDTSKLFQDIFSKIIRKNKFIDYIDIDDEFNINLYVKKEFRVKEVIQLILNLGLNDLDEKLGDKFIDELTKELIVEREDIDKKRILDYLNKFDENKTIKLSSKVDVMNLSSGEKQIYILCLYWALIKSANISIPFIIDTPYARIDEKHRNKITTEFLPKISHQVIVLSTNTEIEENLYNEINKFVSKEYTLDYDNETRSTKVNKGYFYEVK